MIPKASFRAHALSRITERTHLTPEHIADILDSGEALTITIGKEQNTHRAHRLFWSITDASAFVAVQDERNGEVITIFPADSYHSGGFILTVEAREMAKNLALYGAV